MADKTTGELPVVKESPVGGLPQLADIYDDFKMPGEFNGEAVHITGAQWKGYAQAAVATQVTAAQEHAQAAQEARKGAESARDAAKGSASDAARSAEKARQYSGKPPIIQEGRWWVWNADKQEYEDTGEAARGNLMLPVFFLDPKTGLLTMYADQEYTGPDFRIRDGYLEVVLSA